MKKLAWTLVAFSALAGPAVAQGGDLEDKLRKKLESEWIRSPEWITDYDQARAEAKRTGKVIFGYFTRSYAY